MLKNAYTNVTRMQNNSQLSILHTTRAQKSLHEMLTIAPELRKHWSNSKPHNWNYVVLLRHNLSAKYSRQY